MTSKEAFEIAQDIDAALSSDDERFEYSVKLNHVHEGSFQFYDNAFAIKAPGWWFIFTEHHKYFVYDEDDVRVTMYRRASVYDFEEEYEDEDEDKECEGGDNKVKVYKYTMPGVASNATGNGLNH